MDIAHIMYVAEQHGLTPYYYGPALQHTLSGSLGARGIINRMNISNLYCVCYENGWAIDDGQWLLFHNMSEQRALDVFKTLQETEIMFV